MKRILSVSLVVGLLVGAIALSGGQKAPKTELQIDVEKRNPWTHLRVNDAADTFHFVVVSDRTGGHRPRIFSQAVEQINLLQPAFVVSVGDLIEGYSKDTAKVSAEWKEFQSYTSKLQMPFFYVPGNHDVTNPTQKEIWQERFGRAYYHFLYKDVLFLAVNSDDPFVDSKADGKLTKEQLDYFQKVLAANANARWVFVMVHKPMWTHANLDVNGWLELEKMLKGRNYTVFAGHIHRYQKFVRQGMNYYQLATTGGGSRLRGERYGEFDHVAWVTMKKDAPIIANVLLDGIYPENLKKPVTDEEGYVIYNRKPVHPVHGKVTINGTPAANAQVIAWLPDVKDPKKAARVSDAWVEPDGTFTLTTYRANDGLAEGTYRFTVTLREPFFEPSGKPGPNQLPAKYADHNTSELRATIKAATNVIQFDLTK